MEVSDAEWWHRAPFLYVYVWTRPPLSLLQAIYYGNKTAYWKYQPDPKVAASGGFIMADLEKG